MAGSAATKQALLLWGATATTATETASVAGIPLPVVYNSARVCEAPTKCIKTSSALSGLEQLRGGSLDDANNKSDKKATSKQSPKRKKSRSKKSSNKAANADESASASETASTESPSSKTSNAKSTSPLPTIIQEILQKEDYYEILGLHRDQKASITERAIQKAYRRRCVVTHPDKTNGDRRAFDKVAEAYHVLSDADKRAVYDRYGKAGLEHGAAGAGRGSFASSADELFQSFFGGHGGGGGPSFFGAPMPPQRPRRNRTVRYQLEVSLEDLYKGVGQSIQIGEGGGSPLRKTVTVDIPRGAVNGQSICLSGEIDFDTTEAPGDLIFLLKQRQHPLFTRKGHDLAVIMTISLQEAVCGVKRTIQHLNGEQLVIGSARNHHKADDPVRIQTGDVHVLKGKGMPKNKLGTSFGDLYVQYQVELPDMKHDLTEKERTELTRLLDKLEGKRPSRRVDESKLQYCEPSKASDFGHASGSPPPLSQDDEHLDQDEAGGNPFARRSFFYSSSNGREYPFGFPFENESSQDAQCRQM